jgi:hypothetical protein
LRETRRGTGRRELKSTYLDLPPLSIGYIWRKISSRKQPGEDYFERRRRRLVKLILIQGVKSDLNRQLAPVRGPLGLDQGLLKEPELERLPLLKSNL